MADELDKMLAADGSLEREQWCLDNWDAVAASVAAAQNVSLGVASHQLLIADALRERLPRVAEVFTAGAIFVSPVTSVAVAHRVGPATPTRWPSRTEMAAHVTGWGSLSVTKTETAIDYWVDRYDPTALRRFETAARPPRRCRQAR